jgi:hypothetical protein
MKYFAIVLDILGGSAVQLFQLARHFHHQMLADKLLFVLQSSKGMAKKTALCVNLEIQYASQDLLVSKELLENLMWVGGKAISAFQLSFLIKALFQFLNAILVEVGTLDGIT